MVTEPSQWQHVQTDENPGICAQGEQPDELLANSLWWRGPKWLLSEDKAGWPKMEVRRRPASLPELKTSNCKEEEGEVADVLTCRLQNPLNRGGKGGTKPKCVDWRLKPARFTSWTHLVQLQARVWQVVYNMCRKG